MTVKAMAIRSGNGRNRRQRQSDEEEEHGSGRLSNLMHSRSYHRYFRGYTETMQLDEDGREKIVRVYTADWFVLDDTDRNWFGRKIIYALLFIAAAALYLIGLIQDIPSNASTLVAAPGLLLALSLLFTLGTLVLYLSSPRKMTIHEYETGPRNFRIAAFFSAFLSLCTTVSKVLFLFISPQASFSVELPYLVLILLCSVLLFLMYRMERSAGYINSPNPNAVKETMDDFRE